MQSGEKSVLLLVSGSIAAYKAADIASKLVQSGVKVYTALTDSAAQFIGAATFTGITGLPTLTSVFDEPFEGKMSHIHLPQNVDLVLAAPATANLIARFTQGIADDVVSTMLLAATSPVLIAPAMNSAMWDQEATQESVRTLKQRGVHFVEPAPGHLACGTEGQGRLATTDDIMEAVNRLLYPRLDLAGVPILISVGATREPIDPVRFISNRSSGKMGFALAEAARDRGAIVTLVKGHTEVDPPTGIEIIPVETIAEMLKAVEQAIGPAQVFISAAAPADFEPIPAEQKIKKSGTDGVTLQLNPAPDILKSIAPLAEGKVIIGFAAETENLEEYALQKLKAKNLNFIVLNDVTAPGSGFGTDTNAVTLLFPDGEKRVYPTQSKRKVAEIILDEVVGLVG
ncbi:MAG: bifunctional phosphopantothenoylcysteine decarboxylase/phosphopantothenate--cysteine ligase CoaBC [Chthonomonadales bacterium]